MSTTGSTLNSDLSFSGIRICMDALVPTSV
jgi:hypothetical protein